MCGLFAHVDTVIHDLSHRKAVREVNRVLTNKSIKTSIERAIGVEGYHVLTGRLRTIAAGHFRGSELRWGAKALRYARMALTLGVLGYAPKQLFNQLLGVNKIDASTFGVEYSTTPQPEFIGEWEDYLSSKQMKSKTSKKQPSQLKLLG